MPRSTQDPKDRKRDAIDPAGFDALASASVALLEPLQASQWDTAQSTVPIGLTAALRQFSGVAASGGFQALAQLADLIAARLVALVEDECADSPGGSLETLIGCLVEFCAGDPGRAPASRLLEEFQNWAGPSSQPGPRVRKQLAAEAQRLLAFTSWRDGEPMQAPSASSGGNALPLLAQASIELSEEIQTLRRRSGVTDGSLITTVLKRLQAIDQACAAIGATAACEVLAKLQAAVQSCLTDPAPRDERLRMLLAEVSRRLSNYFSAMGPESAQELVALLSEPGWPSRVPARVARRLAADLSELQGLEAGSDERDPSAVTSENLSLEVADDAQPEVVAELLEELSSLAQPLTWHLQAALAGSRQDLAAALRIAHTLKGAAQTATIRGVATLTHRIEDVLEPLAARPSALEPGLRAELLAAVDCLTAMTDALTGRGPEPANASQICDSLGIWAALILSRPREHPGAWEELGQSLAAADPVGDSAHQASDREPPPRAARLRKTLAISGVAARLERVVEQAGRLAGRQVDLVIKGRSLRLKADLLESILDPLSHLLRNAVDHGTEPEQLRRARGKPRAGQLRLSFERVGDQLTVCCSDDGPGLDLDAIEARARQEELLAQDEKITPTLAAQLIFQPGFSTRDLVTPLSGRGIGLDAVREAIEALGGQVRVRSEAGAGTEFLISLPAQG